MPTLPLAWSRFLFKPLQSRGFILFSFVCVGFVSALVVLRRRWYGPDERREQNRFLLVLGILFLVALLPAINLRLSLYQTLGERFLYLPSVFSCLLIAYLLAVFLRNRKLWLVAMVCILAFYSERLYQTNRTWREAAQLSRSIKDKLAESTTGDHLVILNAPDNLRGVPVFHNGLPEAVQYFQNQRPINQIEIIALQSLQSAADEVEMIGATDSRRLNLLNQDDSFTQVRGAECVEVIDHTSKSLAFRLAKCAAGTDLFFFSSGKMIRTSATLNLAFPVREGSINLPDK